MEKLPHDLAQRLRHFRKSRNLSQSELARRINIAIQQYNRYETGRTKVPVDVIVRVADVLEMSTDELLGRKEAPKGGALVEEMSFYDLVYKIKNYRLKDYSNEELQVLTCAAKILADRLEEKKKLQKKSV